MKMVLIGNALDFAVWGESKPIDPLEMQHLHPYWQVPFSQVTKHIEELEKQGLVK